MMLFVPQDERLADRIVAIVNDEPIMLSELYQSPTSELGETVSETELLQNRLESRINQTLILQEARRLRIFTVTEQEIQNYKDQLLEQFGGDQQALQERMTQAGISASEVDAMLERVLLIRAFIDYRFRRSTEIEEEDLQAYYESTFTEEFKQRNPDAPVPQFETVQSLIRTLLVEQQVNDALEQWLADARSRAQIVIRF